MMGMEEREVSEEKVQEIEDNGVEEIITVEELDEVNEVENKDIEDVDEVEIKKKD